MAGDKLARAMFSSRLPASLTPTPIAAAMAEERRGQRIRADLTLSNPTVAGVSYPETMATAWSNADSLHYTPAGLGLPSARALVAHLHEADGDRADADRVVLTASTSEGYGFLFKLLCDAGDHVAAPAPSYPLLDHLAALEHVVLDRYAMHDAGHWTIDLDALEAHLSPRTRAIVVVAPNNPTGSVPDAAEWCALIAICERHRLALVIDEVFAPYRLDAATATDAAPSFSDAPVLVFRLNGLSKLIGMPQAKLAWIRIDGPPALVQATIERLDVIADTYLSVSTPVQLALPSLLDAGRTVREQVQARLERNLQALAQVAAGTSMLTLRRPQGGWTAVLRTPMPSHPDATTQALLAEGVLTHPAYFYDFAHDGYLVVSLLTPAHEFDLALEVISRLQAFGCPS